MGVPVELSDASGKLYWYRHDGWRSGTDTFVGRQVVAPQAFAGYRNVAATHNGSFYGVTTSGDLDWLLHIGWQDGTDNWQGPMRLSPGNWTQFKFLTASDQGTVYGVTHGGDLYWYSHDGWKDQNKTSRGPNLIGRGWGDYVSVFATSQGVIYGITAEGNLLWHRHDGWADGSPTMANGGFGVKVTGNIQWSSYASVFASSFGVIYGVTRTGDLLWFQHDGWQDGTEKWTSQDGVKVGYGWLAYRSLVATTGGYVYGLGVDKRSWMSVIPPNAALTSFTMPGTHDTGTWPETDRNPKCQTLTLGQQLDAGIRFIDIRLVQDDNNGKADFGIYHAGEAQGTWFSSDIVDPCRRFLAAHPSETIVMSVKDESGSTTDWEPHLLQYLTPDICLTTQAVPTLAAARGHIVLFRRYEFGTAGIPARKNAQSPPSMNDWPPDEFGTIDNGFNVLNVQDIYGFGFLNQNIYEQDRRDKLDDKWGFVTTQLQGALADHDTNHWWINFTSASGPPTILDPVDFAVGNWGADGLNARLVNFLAANPKGNYGAVLMDFPETPNDGEVVRRLILANM